MTNTDNAEVQEKITEKSSFIGPLREEIGNVLVGQGELVESLIIGLITDGHVLVEGVPGLAKTLAIKTLSDTIGGSFSRLQFTPDLLPADLTGTTIYNPHDHTFSVKKGPIFSNTVLADEVNRAPAKVQSALLEAMQEHQVTIGGETHHLPEPFLVMATQNPIEQEGTYPLPEAQIDRFMLKAVVRYPSRQEESQIARRMAHPSVDENVMVKQVTSPEQIIEARQWVDSVYLDPKIGEYILDLVFATRYQNLRELSDRQKDAQISELYGLIEYGASPRATLALHLAAKAKAFCGGRAYVLPQDVKDIAPEVLRHRLIPTFEAEAENLTTDDLIQRLLDELRTP